MMGKKPVDTLSCCLRKENAVGSWCPLPVPACCPTQADAGMVLLPDCREPGLLLLVAGF